MHTHTRQQQKYAKKIAKQNQKKSLQEFLNEGDNEKASIETEQANTEEKATPEDDSNIELSEQRVISDLPTASENDADGSMKPEGSQLSRDEPNMSEEADPNGQEPSPVDEPDKDLELKSAVENLSEELASTSLSEENIQPTLSSEMQTDTATHDCEQDSNQSTTDVNPTVTQPSAETDVDQSQPKSNLDGSTDDNLSQSSAVKHKPSKIELLQAEPDSLEGSFKKFCTPELLTGNNQFACAVCTKENCQAEEDCLIDIAKNPGEEDQEDTVVKDQQENSEQSPIVDSNDAELKEESEVPSEELDEVTDSSHPSVSNADSEQGQCPPDGSEQISNQEPPSEEDEGDGEGDEQREEDGSESSEKGGEGDVIAGGAERQDGMEISKDSDGNENMHTRVLCTMKK